MLLPRAVLIVTAALQFPRCRASCPSRPAADNACTLGGSLAVTSVPGKLLVNSGRCNPVYDKEEFQQQPRVRYPEAKAGELYTLVMLDPDAPGRRRGQYYLHWIVANINGGDFKSGLLNGSTVITSYLGPAPPEGTGLHRYMFYVYRHEKSTQRLSATIEDPERQFFTLRDWLRENVRNGVRLCGILSGVQFRSGF
ncbi:OV-16 antigen-like [Homalodisca vitripennis]|uniref:OV-16 antigen-like n=1 Tax=Homalodisca vitripennis TaxID=197043 RepID=UPI001EE9EAE4|nr:OV-16 antigen-like [Homalodisca vitripennis]